MVLLYRIEELRSIEALARARLAPGTLMQRAGEACAEAIDAWLRNRAASAGPASILVLCGPGDNGGDGFVCADALRRMGHRCTCWAPLPSTSADSHAARQRWARDKGPTIEELAPGLDFDVAVDAVLGIGAQRPLSDPFLAALRWVQSRRLPLFAMDLPSGLDADTGTWLGGVPGAPALQTITFLGDKPGLHTLDGPGAAGTVHVRSLGLEGPGAGALPAPSGRLNAPEDFRGLLRPRPHNSHKGDFGAVAVIGGAAGMVGAALLAARAAMRLGAGKVFVDCIGAPELRVDLLQPELMFRSMEHLPAVDTIVAGCGMGQDAATQARVRSICAHPGTIVLDADALNCIAADAGLAAGLRARTGGTVLTPHPGEAARLLGAGTAEVQGDRVASALRLARQTRALVVLKGAGSIIAEPSGRYTINPSGGPALATAGTGDVLAGMIGALLAQHAAGSPRDAAAIQAAVCAAVWLHGRAADRCGIDVGLTASDIAPLAARVLAELGTAS